jgi:hypothetical protein
MKKLLMMVFLSCMTATSFAWNYGLNVTITAITLWEGSDVNPMYFKRSDNVWCYIPAGQKLLQANVMSMYLSGKSADIHCHDTPETPMIYDAPAYKLHRLVMH